MQIADLFWRAGLKLRRSQNEIHVVDHLTVQQYWPVCLVTLASK